MRYSQSARVSAVGYFAAAFTVLAFLLGVVGNISAQDASFLYRGVIRDSGGPVEGEIDVRFRLFDAVTDGTQKGLEVLNEGLVVSGGEISSEVNFGPNAFSGDPVWMEISVKPKGAPDFEALTPRQKIYSIPSASFSDSAADVAGVLSKDKLPADTIFGVNGIVGPSMLPANVIYGDVDGIVGPSMLPKNVVYGDENGIVAPMFLPADVVFLNEVGIVGPSMLPETIVYGDKDGIVGPSMLPPNVIYGDVDGIVGPSMLPEDLVYEDENGRVGIGEDSPVVPLHIAGGTDTGLSGGGYFQTGDIEGRNISMDNNEIMARDKGETATLYLNADGGPVAIGTTSDATGYGLRVNGKTNGGVIIVGAAKDTSPSVLKLWSTTDDGVVIHAFQNSSKATALLSNDGSGYGLSVDGRSNFVHDGPGPTAQFLSSGAGDALWVGGKSTFTEPAGFYGRLIDDIAPLEVYGIPTVGEVPTLQFSVKTSGEVRAEGNMYAPAFVNSSDRDAKENFSGVNTQAVLEKVAALPISNWNFKKDSSTQHIGPMAQDFYAAFGVGPDDKHIATVDADGVALAAIQGLNQKLEQRLEQKESEIAEMKAQFEARLAAIEALLSVQ